MRHSSEMPTTGEGGGGDGGGCGGGDKPISWLPDFCEFR